MENTGTQKVNSDMPYSWQEECLNRWLANGGRGMVQAATGSGKTRLALAGTARLERKLNRRLRVKIVVPTAALLHQWNRALQDYLANSAPRETEDEPDAHSVGLRGGGLSCPINSKYMIYIINSARYELARQILSDLREGYAVLLIADECHRYESGQNRLIFEFAPRLDSYPGQFFSLGLSATLPAGQSLRNLSLALGRKIYTYSIDRAAALQTVCRYDIYHIGLSFSQTEQEEYGALSDRMLLLRRTLMQRHPGLTDLGYKEFYDLLKSLTQDKDTQTAQAASLYLNLSFKRKNLVCLAQARIECVRSLLKLLPAGEKILIFGERIDQAKQLYRILQEQYGQKAGICHSRLGQQANRNALERFRNGEVRILITCKSMDEGVDIPDASIGIILSGTSAQRQRIQRLGRIIRRKEGKDRASLYYLHIAETTEDSCYLPKSRQARLFDLTYDTYNKIFTNPRYDKAASRLLDSLHAQGMSKDKMKEVGRCLEPGRVRADYLPGQTDFAVKVQQAKYASEKNYWICMKKIAGLYSDPSQP